MPKETALETGRRCGFAAVIGAPNAGKSTLVNALVGAKVSIVTHKAQTTRTRVRGIAIEGQGQIILVDTPGIFAPKRRLDRAMVETAWTEAREADIVVLVADAARGFDDVADPILEHAGELTIPLVLVLNKIDKIKKDTLLALAADASKRLKLEELFMISALSGDGVEALRSPTLRAGCRRVSGSSPRTRSPTDRCANGRRKSRARRCSCACTRKFHTRPRSKPRRGRSFATAPSASSRRSLSSAIASARSCSAPRARRSSKSRWKRARRSWKASRRRCICFCL